MISSGEKKRKETTILKKYSTLFNSIIALLMLSSYARSTEKRDLANQALQDFFVRLVQGEYKAAAALYAGSYETLVIFNPDLDPDHHTALWQSGCQVNDLQCLTIRTAIFKEETDASEYICTIEFNTKDGSLFELGPVVVRTQPGRPNPSSSTGLSWARMGNSGCCICLSMSCEFKTFYSRRCCSYETNHQKRQQTVSS